jgi:hypothetical protein
VFVLGIHTTAKKNRFIIVALTKQTDLFFVVQLMTTYKVHGSYIRDSAVGIATGYGLDD